MTYRPLPAAAMVVALTAGVVTAAPAFADDPAPAPGPTTTTHAFPTACHAVPQTSFSGPVDDGGNAEVKITAPETVRPGEVFTVQIDPGYVDLPNSSSGYGVQHVSRFKIDMAVPTNAQVLDTSIADQGSFASPPSVKAPSIIRVDEAGAPAADGPYLRLSGQNRTIANSPTSGFGKDGMSVNITGPKDGKTHVVFPKFSLTLKAGTEGAIDAKLRTAGRATQWNTGSEIMGESFLTFAPTVDAGIGGIIAAPTYCQPRAASGGPLNSGADVLRQVTVAGEPWQGEVVDLATTVKADPAEVTTGTATHLTATTDHPEVPGSVQFYADGTPVGTPRRLVDGIARFDLTFNGPGEKKITARFQKDPSYEAIVQTGESEPLTVTVTGDPIGGTPTTPTTPATTGSLGSLSGLFGSLSPKTTTTGADAATVSAN